MTRLDNFLKFLDKKERRVAAVTTKERQAEVRKGRNKESVQRKSKENKKEKAQEKRKRKRDKNKAVTVG